MSQDPALSYVEDILVAIAHIEDDIAGHDRTSFAADRRTRQLLERNFEIISEASRKLPEDLQASEQSVPWPQVRAVGNILRHEYRAVVADVLWDTATNDIQPLKYAMLRMQEELLRACRSSDKRPRG